MVDSGDPSTAADDNNNGTLPTIKVDEANDNNVELEGNDENSTNSTTNNDNVLKSSSENDTTNNPQLSADNNNAAAMTLSSISASIEDNNDVSHQNQKETKATAATINTSNSNNNSNMSDERTQKIVASLQHRKLLLSCIKHGRIETQNVRNELQLSTSSSATNTNSPTIITGDSNSNSNNNSSRKRVSFINEIILAAQHQNQNHERGEEGEGGGGGVLQLQQSSEITNYETIVSMANRHASTLKQQGRQRHHSSVDTTNNNAILQRDLRRGSTTSAVGKRINTATASLAAGGTASSSIANTNTIAISSNNNNGKQLNAAMHQQSNDKVGGGGGNEKQNKKGRKRKSSASNNNNNNNNSNSEGGIISLPGGMLANKNKQQHYASSVTAAAAGGTSSSSKSKSGGTSSKKHDGGLVPSAPSMNLLVRREILLNRLHDLLVLRERARERQRDDTKLQQQQQQKEGEECHPQQQPKLLEGKCSQQQHQLQNNVDGILDDGDTKMDDVDVDSKPPKLDNTNSCDNNVLEVANKRIKLEEVPLQQQQLQKIAIIPCTTEAKQQHQQQQQRAPSSSSSSLSLDKILSGSTLGKGAFTPPTSIPSKPKFAFGTQQQRQQHSIINNLPSQPQRLPPRTKTQWDNVLEEMKWMAMDFIEERKWKIAVGKSLSSGLKKHHFFNDRGVANNKNNNNYKKVVTVATPSKKKQSAGGGGLRSSSNSSSSSKANNTPKSGLDSTSSKDDRQQQQQQQLATQLGNTNTTNTTINNNDPIYTETLSVEDITNIQKVSRLLSVCILDYWDDCRTTSVSVGVGSSNSSSCSNSSNSSMGSERFRKLRSGALALNNGGEAKTSGNDRNESNTESESLLDSAAASATADDECNTPPIAAGDESIPTPPPLPPAPTTTYTELSYEEISSHITSSIEIVKTIKEQTSHALEKDRALLKYKKLFTFGSTTTTGAGEVGGGDAVDLDSGQLHAVHFLESLWNTTNNDNDNNSSDPSTSSNNDDEKEAQQKSNNNTISAIVGGGLGVGKTITVCALLWKHGSSMNNMNERNENGGGGPQLIICSHGACVRWQHELTKFEGISGRTYHGGQQLGSSNDDNDDGKYYDESNVIICDYASLLELTHQQQQQQSSSSVKKRRRINFSSLVLDLRHSPPPASSSSSPVTSVKWWIMLNNFIMNNCCARNMKRLVVEQTTGLPHNRLFLDNSNAGETGGGGAGSSAMDGASTKRIHEMLAMKLAFIHHPCIFFSERGSSTGKRVISWAKRQVKARHSVAAANDGNNGKLKASSSLACRSMLTSSLQSVYDYFVDVKHPSHDEEEADTSIDGSRYAWEVRMCTLARPQQAAYNHCCTSMPSSGCSTDDHYGQQVANVLLGLRKICIHSNLDDVTASLSALSNTTRRGSISAKIGSIMASNSTTFSEPDIVTAKSIIDQSSKMKELLRVLINECGHNVASAHELIKTPADNANDEDAMSDDVTTTHATKKGKVLILVTLVEAQLLTSFFLNALGLHHEVLVSEEANASSNITLFHNRRSIDIIVASPKAVSSHGVGMDITSSVDTIISIDEDWSGREALHIMSILSRIRRRELGNPTRASKSAPSKSPCKFIKVVCQSTCEDTFLCGDNVHTIEDDTPKKQPEKKTNKRATHKRGARVGGRKSSRHKANQDESKMDVEESVHCNSTSKIKAHTVLISVTKVKANKASVNSNGFIVPPATHEESNEHFVGSNIIRHRNSKLSSILGISNSDDDLFLTTVKDKKTNDATFAWALFNTEDKASLVTHHQHQPNHQLGRKSIMAESAVPSNSVRCFVESFGRSTLFTPQGQSEVPMRLNDPKTAISSQEKETKPDISSNEEESYDSNNPELLVYRLPSATTKKHKAANVELTVQEENKQASGDLFSFTFSASDGSVPAAVKDGNQGCASALYFPAFLPSLLQIIRSQSSKENFLSGTKRVAVDGDIHSKEYKRLRVTASTDLFPPFSFTVETNPHSFRNDQKDNSNVDLNFHRKLLSSDLRGALSYQNLPCLNSMLIITTKELKGAAVQSTTGSNTSKKPLLKKMKKQQHQLSNVSSSAPIKNAPAYFQNEHLHPNSFSTREGLKIKFTASLVGRVRQECSLNDLLSNLFIQTSKPALLGAIPHVEEDAHEKFQSAISISGGRTEAIRSSQKFSSSLEETSEPWTSIEDSILRECLSRYGMNWKLAAHAVSSGMTFSRGLIREATRRSAAQCQNRWSSLETNQGQARKGNSSIGVTSETKEISRFGNRLGRDSIIFARSSSTINRRQNDASNHSVSSVWLDMSRLASSAANSSQNTKEESQHVASRAQIIEEASKKRRVATLTPRSTTPGTIHTSHTETVSTARANMLSSASGIPAPRHEMWPLELLDFRKKQAQLEREARRSAKASARQSSQPSSQPTNQQRSVPYHPQQQQQPQPTYNGQSHVQHPPYHAQAPILHHAGGASNPDPNAYPRAPHPHKPTSTKRT